MVVHSIKENQRTLPVANVSDLFPSLQIDRVHLCAEISIGTELKINRLLLSLVQITCGLFYHTIN